MISKSANNLQMEAIQQHLPPIGAWMTKMTHAKFSLKLTWQIHLHLLNESRIDLCVQADWNI